MAIYTGRSNSSTNKPHSNTLLTLLAWLTYNPHNQQLFTTPRVLQHQQPQCIIDSASSGLSICSMVCMNTLQWRVGEWVQHKVNISQTHTPTPTSQFSLTLTIIIIQQAEMQYTQFNTLKLCHTQHIYQFHYPFKQSLLLLATTSLGLALSNSMHYTTYPHKNIL